MAEILTGATLTPGKVELVQGWIETQRWYAATGAPASLHRLDAWRLDDPDGEVGVEVLLLADRSGAHPVVYQVPLSYRADPLPGADGALVGTLEHSVLGRRWVYDATHDPVYAQQLLALLRGRVSAMSSTLSDTVEEGVRGIPHPTWPDELHFCSARVLSTEQSNTSIVVQADLADGRRCPVIVKVFRMLSPGENPDVFLQGVLRTAGCRRVPGVVGSVRGTWPGPVTAVGPATLDLALAQEFLPGVEDAWREAARAVAQGRDFTAAAHDLGVATAEVHATLADSLGCTPVASDTREAVLAQMRQRFEAAVAQVPDLQRFRQHVELVIDRAQQVTWPPMQRVHGDFHLGQVLHSPTRGWVLVDFEGEPLRPLAERTEPDQWIRDVAGMLRSIDYAGGAWEQEHGSSARTWVEATQQAFLDGYARGAGEDPRSHGWLLAAFELDKAMYETVYEARNRPDWVGIPIAAIDRLTTSTRNTPSGTNDP